VLDADAEAPERTEGLARIWNASARIIDPGADGQSLADFGCSSVLAVERVGQGLFALAGDMNGWADVAGANFTGNDNDRLPADLGGG